MAVKGWYYLHTNGELIYKAELGSTAADIRESDLAVGMWAMDEENRETAWNLLVEGLAAGAKPERIAELATKWKCDNKDAMVYADLVGLMIGREKEEPQRWFAIKKTDVEKAFTTAEPTISIAIGYGETVLRSMTELAIAVGYKPSKMWGPSFKDIIQQKEQIIHLA